MIRILYFASLRERLAQAEEQVDTTARTLAALKVELAARGDVWAEVFDGELHVLAAVNQEMATADQPLQDGDEVGFFPPVTGG